MNSAPLSDSMDPRPALWNPLIAALWSILFSPAFGAVLHARNAEALGRKEEADANWKWFYGTALFLIVSLWVACIPAIPSIAFKISALVLWAAWYFSTGRAQTLAVKKSLRTDYQRKDWAPPLLIAFFSLLGYAALAIAVGSIYLTVAGQAPVLPH